MEGLGAMLESRAAQSQVAFHPASSAARCAGYQMDVRERRHASSGGNCRPTQRQQLKCNSSLRLAPLLRPPPGTPRRTAAARSRAGASGGAERALKSTIELDRFIDNLRATESSELPKVVAENVLSFDQTFWMRLATRAESSGTQSDQRDFEELATTVMALVDRMVRRTQEKMDSSTNVLSEILRPLADGEGGELTWPPPKGSNKLGLLQKAIAARDMEGQLDEGFLSAATAQLRQALEKGDRPGLTALLQKVLQLYAANVLMRRSYAARADGTVDEAEKLVEDLIQAEEERWADILSAALAYGTGRLPDTELFAAIDLRMERMLMRTEAGSYQQRVVAEYLQELRARATALVDAYKRPPPGIAQ